MTTSVPLPFPIFRAFDSGGVPLAGGLLYTYAANTLTPKVTYSSNDTSTPNTNPVVLDSTGTAVVRLIDGDAYKFVLKDSGGSTQWTVDYYQSNYLTAASVGAALYPQTAAELAAGVTPTNYAYPSHDAIGQVMPARYGGVNDATTDSSTALANALLVCAQAKCPLFVGGGSGYLCTTNLTVPVGSGSEIDVIGSGWANGGIKFSGASVTTGLTFTGSSYDYAGTVRNCRILGVSSAVRGVTFTNVNHPRIERCFISGFAGAGAMYDGTLMGVLSHTLFTSCGSATEGSVEVTGTTVASTTFRWEHSRISGGTTTIGGLIINKSAVTSIVGGGIESCGIPIRVGNRADTTTGCVGGVIHAIDLEAPGNNNYYIDFGSGQTVSARCQAWHVAGCNGSPAGSTPVVYAVLLTRANQITFDSNNWGQAGSPTSTYELTGSANIGVHIMPHRNLFGNTCPWVRVNGAQVKAAGPHLDWWQLQIPQGLMSDQAISGTTASILISDTQGGYYGLIVMNNGGATTMTALTNGEKGMEITMRAANGNTTLTHGTGADQFNMVSGANKTLTSGKMYTFCHNGTCWVHTSADV